MGRKHRKNPVLSQFQYLAKKIERNTIRECNHLSKKRISARNVARDKMSEQILGIYLSGTGNTRHCVERLVQDLDNTGTCIPIESEDVV